MCGGMYRQRERGTGCGKEHDMAMARHLHLSVASVRTDRIIINLGMISITIE